MKNLIEIKKPIISNKTGDWCRIPYPGHPKGCPNYGDNNHPYCPPTAPRFEDYFDLKCPIYLIYSEFNLGAWVEKMKAKHQKWSDRQCRCVLYWQEGARQKLAEKYSLAMWEKRCNRVTACPEAMGLNVYVTARLHGLILEPIKSLSICRHVAIIGRRGK